MFETTFQSLLTCAGLFFMFFHVATYIIYLFIKVFNPMKAEVLVVFNSENGHFNYEGSFLPFIFIGVVLMTTSIVLSLV